MATFNVEYKVSDIKPNYSEVRHVKTVLEDPARVAALVQEATASGGGLEFLVVRRVVVKAAGPSNPAKSAAKESK